MGNAAGREKAFDTCKGRNAAKPKDSSAAITAIITDILDTRSSGHGGSEHSFPAKTSGTNASDKGGNAAKPKHSSAAITAMITDTLDTPSSGHGGSEHSVPANISGKNASFKKSVPAPPISKSNKAGNSADKSKKGSIDTAAARIADTKKSPTNDANANPPARNSEEPHADTTDSHEKEEQCCCPRHRPLEPGDTVRVDCKCGSDYCQDGEMGIYIGRKEDKDKKGKDDLLVATLHSCPCCNGQQTICVSHRTKLVCCPGELPPNVRCPISLDIMETPAYARHEPKMQRIELQNLLAWVRRHKTNPLTRRTVTLEDVVVDTKLQSVIKMWQRRNPKFTDVVLRFKVGDEVLANYNKKWNKGVIAGLWGNSSRAPYYSIDLEDGTRVSASSDTDHCVKARHDSII